MFRLLTFLAVLCLSTIITAFPDHPNPDGVLQWRIPMSNFQRKENKKPAAMIQINSAHIPSGLPSFGLTTGELKLFSGHSLNVLKSKCPNVNHNTIFKLHKYIAKRITKAEPVQGKNEQLRTLLAKMMKCSQKVIISTLPMKMKNDELKNKMVGVDKIKSEENDSPFVVLPVLQTVLINVDDGTQKTGKLVTGTPVTTPKPEQKKWAQMTNEERTREIANLFHHFDPQGGPTQPAITLIEPETPTPAPVEPPKPPRNPIVGWLSTIMDTVSSFFRGIFGFGSVRPRRSPEDLDSLTDLDSPFRVTVWRPSSLEIETEQPIDGQQALLTLIDEICRIYCDSCPGNNDAFNFKIAAKELLQFLFAEDSTGLDLAAAHYLNHEFLQSVQECSGLNK